jgi:hypothetical protein
MLALQATVFERVGGRTRLPQMQEDNNLAQRLKAVSNSVVLFSKK